MRSLWNLSRFRVRLHVRHAELHDKSGSKLPKLEGIREHLEQIEGQPAQSLKWWQQTVFGQKWVVYLLQVLLMAVAQGQSCCWLLVTEASQMKEHLRLLLETDQSQRQQHLKLQAAFDQNQSLLRLMLLFEVGQSQSLC